ncbi:UNVERIFIED_CONTAM: hypothetical protein Sradi_1478200 [Sesamum radiatum]|uniref:Uncharacterized protein n=1 Tax=Sesamum radiatum TaxID=300843 RepID=A0AAW2U6B6_SESRA
MNNPDQVLHMIEVYKAPNRDSGSKSFDLPDFFNDRKRKLEKELVKLRRQNLEAKHPTWFEFLNDLSEVQLRDFAVGLKNKAVSVKSRIEFLKSSRSSTSGLDFDQVMMDAKRLNQFYNLNQQQQQQISSVDHHDGARRPSGSYIWHGPTPVEQYYTPPPMVLSLSLPPLPCMPVMSRLQFSTMENYYHDGAALEDVFQDMIR